MKKTEFISEVMAALMVVQQTTAKVAIFYYHGNCEAFSFYIARNKLAHSFRLYDKAIYLDRENDLAALLCKTLAEIDLVAGIKDEPVEEMITVQIPLSKAQEMGVA